MTIDLSRQYDKIGPAYLKGQKEFHGDKIDAPRKFIFDNLYLESSRTRILDIGCGDGSDIKYLEQMGLQTVYGIDSSEFMVVEARKRVLHPERIIHANIENALFRENGYFDAIVGRYSLHNLTDLDRAYQNIGRMLKSGGQFIFTVPHPIRDFWKSKEKFYGKQEIVQIPLYNGAVTVNLPTHTLRDYLSEVFCKHFELENIHEEVEESDEVDHINGMPEFLGISAVKK